MAEITSEQAQVQAAMKLDPEQVQDLKDEHAAMVAQATLSHVGSLLDAVHELNEEATATERGMRAGFLQGDTRTVNRVVLLRLASDLVKSVAETKMDQASSLWLASRVGKAPVPLDPYVVGRQRAAAVSVDLVQRVVEALRAL